MTEPYEVRAPGEDDREGYVIRDRAGQWVVEGWWPFGARGGPHELRIKPAEDADPAKVARGISHATLNSVPLARMTAGMAEIAPSAENFRDGLAALQNLMRSELGKPGGRRGRSPLFYVLVASAYATAVALGERSPIQWIAALTERSPTAVSGWVRTARSMGYLTGERGHTAGELTDKAKELLDHAAALTQQPIVAAIVTSDRGVLVGRRNDGRPPWTFIAGEQEPGERPEDTAIREVKEEAALRIEAGDVIGERVHPKTGRTMVYIAAAPTHGTDVFVGDEAELAEVRWVSLAEAGELMPDMFGPVREYLARTLESGASGDE